MYVLYVPGYVLCSAICSPYRIELPSVASTNLETLPRTQNRHPRLIPYSTLYTTHYVVHYIHTRRPRPSWSLAGTEALMSCNLPATEEIPRSSKFTYRSYLSRLACKSLPRHFRFSVFTPLHTSAGWFHVRRLVPIIWYCVIVASTGKGPFERHLISSGSSAPK